MCIANLQFATGSNTSNPSQLQSPPLRLSAAYDHQPGLRDPPRIFGPNPFILQPGQPSLLTWPPQAMYPGAATSGQELLSLTSTAASTGSLGRTLGGQQQMLVPAVAQLPEASQVGHASVACSRAFIGWGVSWVSLHRSISFGCRPGTFGVGARWVVHAFLSRHLLLSGHLSNRGRLQVTRTDMCQVASPDMCLQVCWP